MHPSDPACLRDIAEARRHPDQVLADAHGAFPLAETAATSLFGVELDRLAGACVLIWSIRQLPAARALLELDGVARRILLCPPDLASEHLAAIAAEAQVDVIAAADPLDRPPGLACLPLAETGPVPARRNGPSEWILFTSGTTGRPKLVAHTLGSLMGPLDEGPVRTQNQAHPLVWSTFYDIRRYGGLQVFLRAIAGGTSLVLSQAGEPVALFLRRAARAGVTHLLGTPTHWRRMLMSPARDELDLRYVRLSGEIADQSILDQLSRRFPGADLTHAYASTEAGVGFEVTDRRAGFPPDVLGPRPGGREIRIVDGTIRMRSPRAASRYLGGESLVDADGFIDTGDVVEQSDGRYRFLGRRGGVINVGGQKLYPEDVEAVIQRHPAVRAAHVRGRASPITGTIVVADVVLIDPATTSDALRADILRHCRAHLPPHKIPASLRLVDDLAAAAGKLERRGA